MSSLCLPDIFYPATGLASPRLKPLLEKLRSLVGLKSVKEVGCFFLVAKRENRIPRGKLTVGP